MTETIHIQTQNARQKRESLWSKGIDKFRKDRIGMISLAIVLVYFIIAILVWFGLIAQQWDVLQTAGQSGPSAEHWFGTTINGQDIFQRAIYSTKTAFEVGLVVAVLATVIGALTGSLMGYYAGSLLDEFILWVMNCIDCIPYFLLVAAIAVAMEGNPYAMHTAMTLAFWTGTARVIRGEVIKLKNMEFTEAAHALGVPTYRIIFRHLMPNTSHILLVEMTLLFITAIKSEVILSFLGLGVKESISWGLMIAEASTEVTSGHFCNFFAASGMLFVLVLAFNLFSDSLQDALDPRKVS
ncbi:ABC transporter permease [Vibrio gazogenes]|jgi:ABC-type dipeptide/oligopeptide/nickel transport system permease subunit|uniref:Peptide/nickel transport system permease protein n=1 Tax=Vibrio gazogenes DSM 21264 = NBRC 103151 TaxID=1123492 RepID=A0A1M4UV45_VIBGA|nr:ABC transporter permease [Vibrio gazogenes]USP15670.1 ABC transporter permease [Vibrio gazogenes]SHE60554.1 peptide/nickel transport system permease protein [Vibrio gazogenes DSM 21264] [Vibrio gazogenes DSM 21264 = NBRC 103151]SJN56125.1 Oligopeptide transport system permease protein OppC [Vibrio gazogenes]